MIKPKNTFQKTPPAAPLLLPQTQYLDMLKDTYCSITLIKFGKPRNK